MMRINFWIILFVTSASLIVGVQGNGLQASQGAEPAATKRQLDALLSFMVKKTEGQASKLWGRNKVERIEVRKYSAFGKAMVIGVAYEVKVGDTTYQVSTSPSAPEVSFWIKSKKAPSASFGDNDRDGLVDWGEFNKLKTPAEKRKLSPQEGAEHRDFWQGQYQAALDELCRFLEVTVE